MKTGKNVVAAFSEDQASRLSGVSKSQLRYWDKTKVFIPAHSSKNRALPFSRIYSFQDILSLRVLHAIRNGMKVSLQHIRDVRARLNEAGEAHWSSMRLWVVNKRLVWEEPETNFHADVVSGQLVSPVVIGEIVRELKTSISEMNARAPTTYGKTDRHRYIQHNALVVAGTRIPVSTIQEFAAAGYSVEQIRYEYPDLTKDDIDAALAHGKHRAAA